MSTSRGRLESATDDLLAIRAADGDVVAFEVLTRRHLRMMRAYAWRLTQSAADADDAVQNALLLAWQQLPRLREPAAVKGWLMRITGRCATDLVRRRHPTDDLDVHPEPSTTEPEPAERAEASGALAALAAALRELPPLLRMCWVLREVGGESYGEIATQLGVPTSTVRGALARARHSLMISMEEWR